MCNMADVVIIGGGLAGSEAALYLANRGVSVALYEQRPGIMPASHKTGEFAEIVCSNSLRSVELTNAHGLLKAELEIMGSALLEIAKDTAIGEGKSLIVDRKKFSEAVTALVESNAKITVLREKINDINAGIPTIIATGPLTDGVFALNLQSFLGQEFIYFYDALAPIVDAATIDYNKTYFKDRHGLNDDVYLNAPLDREEYEKFYTTLRDSDRASVHEFDRNIPYFEACMPVEVMASRGKDTLRFGPLSPRGLNSAKHGRRPHAVIQLRAENRERTMYSLVGFQTRLKYGAQKALINSIPGLEHAEILRYGQIHRNTYINSPDLLRPWLSLKKQPNIFIAGQLTGTEGYVEAIMGGLVAGINLERFIKGLSPAYPPCTTMTGALLKYISTPTEHFSPMNANFGLITDIPDSIKGFNRKVYKKEQALRDIQIWMKSM